MKIIKKKYGLIKDELSFSKDNIEIIKRGHICFVKDMSGKPLNEYELALQEFVIVDFNRTKLSSMIYGVSRGKRECLSYHQKSFNPRTENLIKPSDSPSSSSYKKGCALILSLLVKQRVQTNQDL